MIIDMLSNSTEKTTTQSPNALTRSLGLIKEIIIEKAADFTVSVPGEAMKGALMFCGTKSGRDVDKFKACSLVPVEAQQTVSPVLMLKGIHLECLIRFKAPMNPALIDSALEELYPAEDYHTLYFGEIVACYETEAP